MYLCLHSAIDGTLEVVIHKSIVVAIYMLANVCVPDCSVAAFGVSLAVALENTPTVGRLLSTIPMASYPTSGPRSLLKTRTHCEC